MSTIFQPKFTRRLCFENKEKEVEEAIQSVFTYIGEFNIDISYSSLVRS